ncbi:uncharacterized protein B0P05DRAFT_576595 [Gilbertella persicaria]|uniref:uncharacterized protein n=1 Tax=Gilbertella persicaria TaxID=101096 RepID=UPI00221FB1CE|nr:uncharacterized protein B0P05DRAFT_576595 [Gilbertella persicaria]KAI8098193.1 hypothetical protein B0P05DRAFT_576595 [Gilbertella persicaria]
MFYEDGQSEILDENGAEAMDWEEEGDPFNIETLMTLTQYQRTRVMSNLDPAEPRLDTVMEEVEKCIKKEPSSNLFLYCLRLKLMSVVAAGRHARIVERTAQKWAKRLREDPDWDIYEKETNKFNRKPSQLQAEHKYHLINFFDEHPQARKEDAVESLTKAFEGFNLKKSSVGSFILNECNLTVKRVTRHPEGRNTPGRIEERRL